MATRSVAAVFGGSGFIGRYVVKRLVQDGHVVRVIGRDPESAQFLKTTGRVGQVVPLFASLSQEGTVARAVEGAEIVVNLVGILAEARRGQFDAVHVEGAERVARLAAAAGVRRLVQVSAIGADAASPSAYGRSKAAGEAAVRAAFAGATIVRPSIVFGEEDQFFNRFGKLAALSPVMPVIAGATRFQPVFVGDVADAIQVALNREDCAGRVYELGGPQVMSFREILQWILHETHRARTLMTLSPGVAGMMAAVGDVLPLGLTRDQLRMLGRDNVVSPGAEGLAALGITPTPIDLVVPAYLDRYRQGGGRRDEYTTESFGPDRL